MAISDINAVAAELAAAIAASNWPAALNAALRMQTWLLAQPNAGDAQQMLHYDRAGLANLIVNIRQQLNASVGRASGGIQRTKIIYREPGERHCGWDD
jgi:hypothetical protein